MRVKIRLIEADEVKIKELEEESAFTWEGMTLDQENLDAIANAFVEEQLVLPETEDRRTSGSRRSKGKTFKIKG